MKTRILSIAALMLAFMSSKKLSATGFATIGTISGGKRKLMKFNLRGGYNNRQFFKFSSKNLGSSKRSRERTNNFV